MNKAKCDYNCDDYKRAVCVNGGQDVNEEELLEYYEECCEALLRNNSYLSDDFVDGDQI